MLHVHEAGRIYSVAVNVKCKLAILKQKQLLNKLFVLHKRPDIILNFLPGIWHVTGRI